MNLPDDKDRKTPENEVGSDTRRVPFKRERHELPVIKPTDDKTSQGQRSLEKSPAFALLPENQKKWIHTVLAVDATLLEVFVHLNSLGSNVGPFLDAIQKDEHTGLEFLRSLKKQPLESIVLEVQQLMTGKSLEQLQAEQRDSMKKKLESSSGRSTKIGSGRSKKPLQPQEDELEKTRQMLLALGYYDEESINQKIERLRGETPVPPDKEIPPNRRILDAILTGNKSLEELHISANPNRQQCESIFRLYQEQLSYRKKRERLTSRKVDVKDYYGGWIVFTPQTEQDVIKRAPFTTIIPDPSDKNKVMAFVEFSWLGNGISEEDLQNRFLQMEKDSIQPSHKSIILNKFCQRKELKRVAWIEMSAADQTSQRSAGIEGSPELLEMLLIYKIFTQHPEIDHIMSEILSFPDVNLGSLVSHRMRFGIEVVAKRVELTPRGRFDWLIVDHPLFREMIKKYPQRKLSFEEFAKIWRSLLPKNPTS